MLEGDSVLVGGVGGFFSTALVHRRGSRRVGGGVALNGGVPGTQRDGRQRAGGECSASFGELAQQICEFGGRDARAKR